MIGFKISQRHACRLAKVGRFTLRYKSCAKDQTTLKIRLLDLAAVHVHVLSPCLNRSDAREWNVEGTDEVKAIRCSLSFVQGVGEDVAQAIVADRKANGQFTSLHDVGRRLWFVPRDGLEWLTLAGALDSLMTSRRQVLRTFPVVHHPPSKMVKPLLCQESLPLPIPPFVPTDVPDFSQSERFTLQWQAWSAPFN